MLKKLIQDHHLVAMVVDDTLTIRKLMEKMLLKLGFDRVDCYENGKKGLEALLAAPVDIVFSDVQMPIMTGPEVHLYRCFYHTPLTFHTVSPFQRTFCDINMF